MTSLASAHTLSVIPSNIQHLLTQPKLPGGLWVEADANKGETSVTVKSKIDLVEHG